MAFAGALRVAFVIFGVRRDHSGHDTLHAGIWRPADDRERLLTVLRAPLAACAFVVRRGGRAETMG